MFEEFLIKKKNKSGHANTPFAIQAVQYYPDPSVQRSTHQLTFQKAKRDVPTTKHLLILFRFHLLEMH